MTRSEKLSNLFCEDYRVIDFLPKAVPETAGDFFGEAESYFLCDKQLQDFLYKNNLYCFKSFVLLSVRYLCGGICTICKQAGRVAEG